MYTRFTASHICPVHKVVVEKSEVVIGFQSQSLRHAVFHILPIEIISHEHQNGTDSLSSKGKDILYGFIKINGLFVKWELGQCLIYLFKDFVA